MSRFSLSLVALVFALSPIARASDASGTWGGHAKSMLAEVAKFKTVGDYNEQFLRQIDDENVRMRYDSLLAPHFAETFPKFEISKEKRAFKVYVDDIAAEFVLVSAKDSKWTVNGVEWTTGKTIDNPKAMAKLEKILFPKKTSSLGALVSKAQAADGEQWRAINRATHGILFPVSYLAEMVDNLDECWQRVGMNTWLPAPFSYVEAAVVDVAACIPLSVVWPLSQWADRRSDPLGLKNLPEKQRVLPRLTCPSAKQRELKVEFLATEALDDRVVFTSYRWQLQPQGSSRPNPATLTFRNAAGGEYRMNYSVSDRSGEGQRRLTASNGETFRMGMSMANSTTIAFNRFNAICSDPAKLRDYANRFNAQERGAVPGSTRNSTREGNR